MRPEVNKVRLTVLIALLFSALCAGVFRTTPIIFMASLLCGAPFVVFILATISSRKLRLTRTIPETGTVGDTIAAEILLSNTARWPVFLIHTDCSTTEPKRTSGRRSKLSASPRPPALVPLGSGEWVVPILRGHETVTHQQQWLLQRRGVHTLAPVRAGALDPLGLYNKLPAHSNAGEIVVLPRPVKIEQLGFLGGVGASTAAPRHSTIVADASDFHGVRPWQPGETVRRAHWKSTARTGRLHVIEWEETPAADMAIFLDTSAQTITTDEKSDSLEMAITAAASVICHLLENGCRTQLFFYAQPTAVNKNKAPKKPSRMPQTEQPSPPLLRHMEARSVEGGTAILRALAEIEPVTHPEATLQHLVEAALPAVARNAGVLLLASTRADLAGALAQSQAKLTRVRCHAIAFASETPHASQKSVTQSREAATAVEAAMPAARVERQFAARPNFRMQARGIQVIQGDTSLAAALEQRA